KNENKNPENIACFIDGIVILKNAPIGVEPRPIAANSKFLSILCKLANTVTNTIGIANTEWDKTKPPIVPVNPSGAKNRNKAIPTITTGIIIGATINNIN